MRARNVQAIVVIGETTLANPDLTYVVGGSLARGGIYFKRAGNDPLLLTSNLDIRTAQKYGTVKTIKTYTEVGSEKLATRYGRSNAYPRLIKSVLTRLGVEGKVALFGRTDLANGIYLSNQLRRLGIHVIGERTPTILESVRETKSNEELASIRDVGLKTSKIVNLTLAELRNLRTKRGHLFARKHRATIGLIKQKISIALAAEGLFAPEGTIFAQGESSADPHDSGDPRRELKQRKLIVFDIFPQAETGYWFDLTRTILLGRADRKARKLFETVKDAQSAAIDSMKESSSCKAVTSKACDVIERNGYRTLREMLLGKSKNVSSGFIHSLGHGVGLTIGERPYMSLVSTEHLKETQVVTVEPGIYLPRYGGVRIEDTVAITKGGIDNLAGISRQEELEVN